MEPPIILNENGDLSIFDSVRAAEEYVEPIDVRNNEYVAFDRNGRRLELRVVTRRGWPEQVEILEQQDVDSGADELREALYRWLSGLGLEEDKFEGLSLEELIHRVRKPSRRRR